MMLKLLRFSLIFFFVFSVAACTKPNCDRSDLSKHVLLKGLSADGTILQVLDPSVGDAELAQLSIPLFKNLKVLILRNSAVTDRGLESIKNLPLEILDLSDTNISDKGIAHLSNLPLKRLILKDTKITDSGLYNLKGLPLEWLILNGTKLTNAGLVYLQALPLKALNLSNTKIDDEGLVSLKDLSLERLDLNNTAIIGPGLAYAAAIPSLKYLSLADSKIDEGILKELAKKRPDLKIVTEHTKTPTAADQSGK